jgi:methylase of polypeptide subunit release factors
MGTGSAAILGLAAYKRGCEVTATELHELIASQAELSIAHAGASMEVRRGPFFADCAAGLDLVLFNPPYVPTQVGVARGLPKELRTQWDGGECGTSVISGFLDAVAARQDAPRVLMGVNRRHVPREEVEALISAHSGLELEAVEASSLGADVYFFSTKKSPMASASSPQA